MASAVAPGNTSGSPALPLSAGSLCGAQWPLSPERERQLVGLFLILGLAARVLRFALRFPLWEDECFVCANILERDYAGLTQPMVYCQVAPLLFLWITRAMADLFGPSEWSLRLLGFVSSLASLGLFWQLSRRLLAGSARVIAVGIFAVAYAGTRYAAEAKPYGSDLAVSLVLLVLAVEWWRAQEQTRWLWLLVLFVPLAIGLSYPAAFVGGGVSLAVGWALVRRRALAGDAPLRRIPAAAAWVAFNTLLVGSFIGFFLAATRAQDQDTGLAMRECWASTFPPLHSLWQFLVWFAGTHCSDMLAYPVGGPRAASSFTTILFVIGLWGLWKSRHGALALLCLAPLGLNLLAAALHRYPYGGHVKFAQYAAPAVCLLAGLGAGALLGQLRYRWEILRDRGGRFAVALRPGGQWGFQAACALLVVIVATSMARDLAWPYKSMTTLRARDFARWFWHSAQQEGEAVCVRTDLGVTLSPQAYHDCTWSAMVLCNMYLYSPRHRRHDPPRLDALADGRPLRCLVFRDPTFPFDEPARDLWLDQMQTRFRYTGMESYPVPCYGKREDDIKGRYYLEIYSFAADRALAGRPAQDSDGDKVLRH